MICVPLTVEEVRGQRSGSLGNERGDITPGMLRSGSSEATGLFWEKNAAPSRREEERS